MFHYYGSATTKPEFYNIVFVNPTANNNELGDFINGNDSELSTFSKDVVTLYSIGDLTIDNSNNKLEAKWSNLDKKADNAKLKGDELSKLNPTASAVLNPTSIGTPTANTWYQLGSEMLVPVQPKPNFSIYYKMNGKYYLYEVNAPRGTWEMGKKYIYNITINFTSVSFDCDVQEWELGGVHDLDII